MANWKAIKDSFSVDGLFDLYIKVTKKTPVIQFIDGYGKAQPWKGWTLQSNTIAGKLYSWIDGTEFSQYGIEDNIDGIYLLFYGTDATGGKTYMIKLVPGLIDWEYVKVQLDYNRKAKMNFYEGWFDDVETNLVELYQEYDDAANAYVEDVKKKLLIGGVVLVGGFAAWTYWNSYYKYKFLLKSATKTIKKELKA
jgi:hypothetical protein